MHLFTNATATAIRARRRKLLIAPPDNNELTTDQQAPDYNHDEATTVDE